MHTAMSCSATPSRRRSAIRQAAATAALGAVLVGTAALTAAPAMALTFKIGDLDAVVDTTLTASVAMRTQGADERSFIPGVSPGYPRPIPATPRSFPMPGTSTARRYRPWWTWS